MRSEHAVLSTDAGSPFSFTVADPDKVCASGEGLDMVRTGHIATFLVSATAARLIDFCVKITGKTNLLVKCHVLCCSIALIQRFTHFAYCRS